jgi:hypothetical protein
MTKAKEKTPVWVDWSGHTAVWVCDCGAQGFAGMTADDGRHAAKRHRADVHPEWEVFYSVYVTPVQCAWGESPWGLAREETCDALADRGEYCVTHYTMSYHYAKVGLCTYGDCVRAASLMPVQPLCKTCARAWAYRDGLNLNAVRTGAIRWEDAA